MTVVKDDFARVYRKGIGKAFREANKDRFKTDNDWWHVDFDTPKNAIIPRLVGKHYDKIIMDDLTDAFFGRLKPKYVQKEYAAGFMISPELLEDDMYKDDGAQCASTGSPYPSERQTDEQFALQQEFDLAQVTASRVSNLYNALNEFSRIYVGCKSFLTSSQKREFRKLVEKMLNT